MTLLVDICSSFLKVGLLLVGVIMIISGDEGELLYWAMTDDCGKLLLMLVLVWPSFWICLVGVFSVILGRDGKLRVVIAGADELGSLC